MQIDFFLAENVEYILTDMNSNDLGLMLNLLLEENV